MHEDVNAEYQLTLVNALMTVEVAVSSVWEKRIETMAAMPWLIGT